MNIHEIIVGFLIGFVVGAGTIIYSHRNLAGEVRGEMLLQQIKMLEEAGTGGKLYLPGGRTYIINLPR